MSAVKFVLENPRNEVEGYIRMRVKIYPGQYVRYYINEKVKRKYWLSKKNRVSSKHPEHLSLNKHLDYIERKFSDARRDMMQRGDLTGDSMRRYCDSFFRGKAGGSDSIYPDIDRIIASKANSQTKDTTARKYLNVKSKLMKVSDNLRWSDIDIDFVYKFIEAMYADGIATNTVSHHVGTFKTIISEAFSRGYTDNTVHLNKRFKVALKPVINTYLSIEELDNLFNHAFTHYRLSNARDLLLIGCYSGQRYGDWHKIQTSKKLTYEGKEYYQVTQQKGGQIVYIPAFEKLDILLQRSPRYTSNQKLNVSVKDVCREAGIDSVFVKPNYKGGKTTDVEFKKYEIITTHTARRSFVCNCLTLGVPTELIRRVTGHKTEKEFRKYVALSSLDGVKLFEDPF